MQKKRVKLLLLLILSVSLLPITMAPSPLSAAEPEYTEIQQARYEQGLALFKQKKVDEAAAVARMLCAEYPKWHLSWMLLGMTYTQNEAGYERAGELFEHAHKLNKEAPEPLQNLAAIAQKQGKVDEAAKLMLQASDLAEDDVNLQLATARLLTRANRREEAKQRYAIVLAEDPEDLQALTGLGALYVDIGEYTEAINLYKEVFKDDSPPILYLNLGDAYVRAARYDEALELVEKGLERRPEPGLYTLKARALLHKEDYAAAEETLKQTIEQLTPNSMLLPSANYFLGIALAAQGCSLEAATQCQNDSTGCCEKDREALAAFEKVFELNPTYKDIVIRLGLAQFAVGKTEDAEATLRNYVDEEGDKVAAEAFGALAVTLYAFGEERDIAEAIRLFREARELAPDFDDDERLRTYRQWPPYARNVIIELKKQAELARPDGDKDKSGCSCSITRQPQELSGALLLFFALFLIRLRKKQ